MCRSLVDVAYYSIPVEGAISVAEATSYPIAIEDVISIINLQLHCIGGANSFVTGSETIPSTLPRSYSVYDYRSVTLPIAIAT